MRSSKLDELSVGIGNDYLPQESDLADLSDECTGLRNEVERLRNQVGDVEGDDLHANIDLVRAGGTPKGRNEKLSARGQVLCWMAVQRI